MAKGEKKKKRSRQENARKSRGATRANQSEENGLRWGRYVLGVVFIGLSTFGLSKVNWQAIAEKAESVASRPVAGVKIVGEFKYVSKEKVQDVLFGQLSGNFMDIDLRTVKSNVESDPWIDEVSIQRIWPDNLEITISEHYPIARWADSGFINRDGELVNVESNEVLGHLPVLAGLPEKSSDIAKKYLVFSQILGSSGLALNGIDVDGKMSWALDVDAGFRIVLGQANIQEKLENFLHVYNQKLRFKRQEIVNVDMRYENGLAVRWLDKSETSPVVGRIN